MAGIVGFDHDLRRSQPHRLDQGEAIADCGAKSLRIGQRRELLAGVIAGCAAPRGNKVGGVLQGEFFVGRQGFQCARIALLGRLLGTLQQGCCSFCLRHDGCKVR